MKNHLRLRYTEACSEHFRMLVVIPAFFVFGLPASAAVIVGNGTTLDVDSTADSTDYLVRDNSVLNLTGAVSNTINVTGRSSLNINGATVIANTGLGGISISSSRGNINNAVVTSDTVGLSVNRNLFSSQGSTVTVNDSQFKGGRSGIQITGTSALTLVNSEVTGTAANSVGLNMIGGEVRATAGTRISGDIAGVRLVNDPSTSSDTLLVLDTASVEGRNGAAILLERGINASIEVLNNSTLQGSADRLISVEGASTAAVKVANSTLDGNVTVSDNSTANLTFDRGQMNGEVLVDSSSTANVTLRNHSQFTGRLDNVDSLILDSSSQFTGDLDNVDNVTLDNYSQFAGRLDNVGSVTLQNRSELTGDLENVDSVILKNHSGLTGHLNNVDSVTLQDHSQLTGRLDKVRSVNISSNSNWTMTANDSIGALSLDGGSVTFGAADGPTTYYRLNVGTLSGNGTFVMKGDFASGERDFLNVTGASAGDFGLAVAASGLDAASPQQLILARTATVDAAQFALAGNSVVDVGTWSYSLSSRENGEGGKDWFLDPATEVISPGASSILALFNTAPTVWYGELSSLRSRMGELRFNGGDAGGWIRTYGNKYNVAAGSGVGYQQQQQGLSLGADARIGESQVLVGVLAGTSKSDLDLNRGTSGTVKSYYVGPYVTWLDSETGYYFDGVLKFNRFRNESKVNLSDGSRTKGDYDNWGVGASAEFGRHIKLADDYFIEPFTQLSAVQIQGKQYTLDNEMDADGDRMRSLVAKAGATVGRNFSFNDGAIAQPYLRAAVAHEFASNNEVKVNDNVFNNDLSGSRAEFGAGVAVALSAKWQVHADFDYSKGEHIEQPWGANVGVRFSW